MDAFYAAVEQRDRLELRGRAVIVGWSDAPRGVVVSASYEARRFGVRSAMPATRAARLCPQALWVAARFDRYLEVSRQVRAILLRHTPLVEPLSLDEAYLDVTTEATGLPTAAAAAAAIRAEIRAETGLTASAGVAPNKFLAKIASDWRKPDGLFVIKPHQVEAFLAPLPVDRLPGVGRATERLLAARGVTTVGDLRRFELATLTASLGRFGERLYELCRGVDEHPVEPDRPTRSLSTETTFASDRRLDELDGVVTAAAREVFAQAERRGRIARTVTVKLRTARFRTLTRRETPARTPASAEDVATLAAALLARFGLPPAARFRLAGVGLSNFLDRDDDSPQRPLF